MTYDQLVDAIGRWLNKVEIEPSIPDFITLCEAQINRSLSGAGITGATQRATATVDSEYAAAPSDLARPVSARHVTSGDRVEIVSLSSLETLKSTCPTETGAPRYVAYVGGDTPLRFWPVPDTSYSVELNYQAKLEPIGATEATNWVLTDHPDVYLYGALMQSAPFLGEDARIATWGGLYASAMAAMIEAESDKRGTQKTPGFRTDIPRLPSRHWDMLGYSV